ncbi:hypothetical protein EMPG_12938 [Blastomyces silverae]|uniref:Uncharacterized protein n=1 Tax=Blastomyces silverae TaxID=2060906 RepID=A0A0H1BK74_9EURO|nr:hypothetical protein EMPG_12938 [Blastomyces silverae]
MVGMILPSSKPRRRSLQPRQIAPGNLIPSGGISSEECLTNSCSNWKIWGSGIRQILWLPQSRIYAPSALASFNPVPELFVADFILQRLSFRLPNAAKLKFKGQPPRILEDTLSITDLGMILQPWLICVHQTLQGRLLLASLCGAIASQCSPLVIVISPSRVLCDAP